MVASSVVVIAVCLVVISFSLATLAQIWDPCTAMGGVVMLPLPLAMAICQYRGIFRRDPKSASDAANLLFAVGGLAWFGFFSVIGGTIVGGGDIPWVPLLLPMAIVGAAFVSVGWMNLRWKKRIEAAASAAGDEPRAKRVLQFSTRELLAGVAMFATVVGLTTYFIRSTPPRYAEHVDRSEAPVGLPAGATDVCYARGSRGSVTYEFTIDEQGFRDWVESRHGSLRSQAEKVQILPIEGEYTIYRYYHLSPDLTGPSRATVTEGLYYDWHEGDSGVEAVFDRSTNRAYYRYHSY